MRVSSIDVYGHSYAAQATLLFAASGSSRTETAAGLGPPGHLAMFTSRSVGPAFLSVLTRLAFQAMCVHRSMVATLTGHSLVDYLAASLVLVILRIVYHLPVVY